MHFPHTAGGTVVHKQISSLIDLDLRLTLGFDLDSLCSVGAGTVAAFSCQERHLDIVGSKR